MKNAVGKFMEKVVEKGTELMAEVKDKVVEKGTELLVEFGFNEGKSFIGLDSNKQSLQRKWEELSNRASDIEEQLKTAELSGKKKRKREVNSWLEKVKKINEEFSVFNRENGEGFLCNLSSGNHRKRIDSKMEYLMEQSRCFDELLLDANECKREPRLTRKLFGEKFKQNLDEILQCLLTDNTSLIGIHGIGGVGKTELAKHIHNQLLTNQSNPDNHFLTNQSNPDFRVYWVTVSRDFTLERMQYEVARIVGLDLSDEDDGEKRAAMLSRELKKLENLVIFFDDVWEAFCLEMLGISPGATGCRLILTTPSSQVCRRMGCQRLFEAKTLNEDEAWELFAYALGEDVVIPAEVIEIAKAVARRSAGLPLRIIEVADNMRGVTSINEWRCALD